MAFLRFVRSLPGSLSAVERPMADSLMGRALSGLSVKHMFEQIFCMSFVWSDRLAESRSWMSPSPKDWRKMSKEIRHGFFMS